ncbi:MAG: hypothetical protein MUP11_10870 [Anaerolineales bacterium]|nr:hypothetical protein [Anaerolineales bacterium]
MTAIDPSAFTELSDFWLSITRKDFPNRGFGKWMLFTEGPLQLYQLLRDQLLVGALRDAFSIKTKAEPPEDRGAVYVHTAPYTDREKVLRLAEELLELDRVHQFQLTGPLLFKTDLHNTWAETISRPGDGYHELLKRNWLYRYEDGKLMVNAVIQALHQSLEDPPENADPAFLLIRSLLPRELFAGSGRPEN